MSISEVHLPEWLTGESEKVQALLNVGYEPNVERIVGWVDEFGTIKDDNNERIGDVVGMYDREESALIMRYRGDQMSRWGYNVGDRVIMDNKVPGKVDGFYKGAVVFQPDWKWGQHMWGRLDRHDKPDLGSQDVKLTSFSTMLVHPDNLKHES